MARSIDGALAAIESCNSMPFGDRLFVHVPYSLKELAGHVVVPTLKQVPDAEATDEVWVKAPVRLSCIGEIEVMSLRPESKTFMHGGQKMEVDLFAWKWISQSEQDCQHLI